MGKESGQGGGTLRLFLKSARQRDSGIVLVRPFREKEKVLKSFDFRTCRPLSLWLMVEISGIEPLTS